MISVLTDVNLVNLFIYLLICLIIYKLFNIFKNRTQPTKEPETSQGSLNLEFATLNLSSRELKIYNGISNPRLLTSIKGTVYDISKAAQFYGPSGPYHNFAGREIARSLATSTISGDKEDDLEDLNSEQVDVLEDWVEFFKDKYRVVGKLV